MKSLSRYGIATATLLIAGLLTSWCFHSIVYGQQDDDQQNSTKQLADPNQDADPQSEQNDQQDDELLSEEDKEFKRVMGVTLTADELLDKMKSVNADFAGHGELKGDELEKAKTTLRERFAFESIRSRMSFQADAVPQSIKRNEPANGEIPTFSRRGWALAVLHSEEVEDFINRPGQGFRRSRIISPYDLEIRSQWAKNLDTRPVDSTLLGEPTINLKPYSDKEKSTNHVMESYSMSATGMPTTNLVEMFHNESSRGFANRESVGLVRNLDEVAGFDAHQTRFPESWDGSIRVQDRAFFDMYEQKPIGLEIDWKINRLQLVSLLLHDEPRVYESENLPNMEELSGVDAKTRALNDFETESLKKLLAGEEIVMHATPNRLVMVGALRADASCMQCHSIKEKELLGAFSYEFLRDPRVEIRMEDH